MNNIGNDSAEAVITDKYLLVVDNKGNIIDTIMFSPLFKMIIAGVEYPLETKNTFFKHPKLKGSTVKYGKKLYKILFKKDSGYKETFESSSDIPILSYDLINSSKLAVEAVEISGTQEKKVSLILSGVRTRDRETCYADALIGDTLLVNAVIDRKHTASIYISSSKRANILLSNIEENFKAVNVQFGSTLKLDPEKQDVVYNIKVYSLKKQDIKKQEDDVKKIPYTSANSNWKTAWQAASIVANSEVPFIPFDKNFGKELGKKFSGYVGFDKDRDAANENSFGESKFYTREEASELITKYNVFNNGTDTLDTKGNGMFIMNGATIIKNSTMAISLNSDGIDIENLRTNSSVVRSSSGIIPVETSTVASNDIRPTSNLFMTAPRKIPNIYDLQKVFDIIYGLFDLTLITTQTVITQIELYNEYMERVKKEQEEAKDAGF